MGFSKFCREKHTSFQIPYPVLAVAIGTLISRFGTSMVVPYLGIFLVHVKHLALYFTGIILGVSYIAQSFGATLMIRATEKIQALLLIKMALITYAILFIILGLISRYSNNHVFLVLSFMTIFILIGCCRSIIETVGQTIISHIAPAEKKHFAFSIRYTFANIGTSLGPMTGVLFGIISNNIVYYVAATAILLYCVLIHFTVTLKSGSLKRQQPQRFSNAIKLFMVDQRLRYFIIAAILFYMGFIQIEFMFALISYSYTTSTHVFAVMYAINGFSVIIFQIPLVRFIKRYNLHSSLLVGIILLSSSLVIIALAHTQHALYYFGVFVFTIGEILTLSLVGLYTDSLAPPENRYLYFGISNFAFIGSMLGPPISSLLSHLWGLSDGLIVISLITLSGIPFILLAKKSFISQCNKKLGYTASDPKVNV